jgi:hypothetical protein
MSKQKQASNMIMLQVNSCCSNFLENQIRFIIAVRQTLEEFDKETVIKQIDQILNYYQNKLTELSK